MSKSDAMWRAYWALRCELESSLIIWLTSLARGEVDDVVFWQDKTAEHAEVTAIVFTEYKRLLVSSQIKRQRRAA